MINLQELVPEPLPDDLIPIGDNQMVIPLERNPRNNEWIRLLRATVANQLGPIATPGIVEDAAFTLTELASNALERPKGIKDDDADDENHTKTGRHPRFALIGQTTTRYFFGVADDKEGFDDDKRPQTHLLTSDNTVSDSIDYDTDLNNLLESLESQGQGLETVVRLTEDRIHYTRTYGSEDEEPKYISNKDEGPNGKLVWTTIAKPQETALAA